MVMATRAAIASGKPHWEQLEELLKQSSPRSATSLAAQRLITNHVAVLKDVCNANPVSQLELTRAHESVADHVDTALRELARRLIRHRKGADALEKLLDTLDTIAVGAWATTARFLDGRIQSAAHERPGREPDMSLQQAIAMRQVLQEVWWESYQATRRNESRNARVRAL